MEFSDSKEAFSFFRSWKWASLLGIVAVLLFLSGFLVWLTPLPIFYAFRRLGWKWALFSGLLSLIALFFLDQWLFATWEELKRFPGPEGLDPSAFWVPGVFAIFLYYGFYYLLGFLLAAWEPKAAKLTPLFLKILAAMTLGLVLALLLETRGHFFEFFAQLKAMMQALMQRMVQDKPSNAEAQEQLAFFRRYQGPIVDYALRLLPAFWINFVLFVTWLNLVVIRKMFVRYAVFPRLETFSRWAMSFAGVWTVIGLAGLFVVDIYFFRSDLFRFLALNGFLVFALVYFFQGLAVVIHFVARWSVAPLLRLAGYLLLVLFFYPVALLLLVVGFFDSWINFRKLTPGVSRP